jgi:hypothetical protein
MARTTVATPTRTTGEDHRPAPVSPKGSTTIPGRRRSWAQWAAPALPTGHGCGSTGSRPYAGMLTTAAHQAPGTGRLAGHGEDHREVRSVGSLAGLLTSSRLAAGRTSRPHNPAAARVGAVMVGGR